MNDKTVRRAPRGVLLVCCLAASFAAMGASLKSLTVCADPGNMPLSNQKGDGIREQIAQVIGAALGTGVQYYWRPSIERGLMRTTLSEGNCDLWLDMVSDTEGAAVLSPLYRSTFVLAYRSDRGIDIKSLDDPALKKLAHRSVPSFRHADSLVGAPHRRQHGDSLSESQRRHRGCQSAFISDSAGDRRYPRRGRGVGPDGGILQDRVACPR